jgi:hypothetical protein
MTDKPHAQDTHSRLMALLDLMPAGCDPDFDDGREELERQFAEIRLTLGND